MESIFVNKAKSKLIMSNLTHKEHKVYDAHGVKQGGLIEYVDILSFNEFKLTLMKVANDNLEAKEAQALAVATLKKVLAKE